MALTRKEALKLAGILDFAADSIQKQADDLGLTEKIANDFCGRCDAISDFVERSANIKRDKTGALMLQAGETVWDPNQIGVEQSGPGVQDPDEAFMKGQFSSQENRELSDRQEAGDLGTTPILTPRNPTPGKQADLDNSLAKLRKLANDDEVQSIASLSAKLKVSAQKLKASGVAGVTSLTGSVNKMAEILDRIQGRLIEASSDGDLDFFVQDEASKAIQAASEVEPYLVDLSSTAANVKAGSSPRAQLEAEDLVSGASEKLTRLVALASNILGKSDKKIASLLKEDVEE